MRYYYKSEKMAAYWALKNLADTLPETPKSARESPEWGTIVFRWEDLEEGGYCYAYQWPLYASPDPDGLWRPLGRVPAGTEEWAYCHTHPNDTFFSTIDTATAEREKTVMYMVCRSGAYWFDGKTEGLSRSARFGILWGTYPGKD